MIDSTKYGVMICGHGSRSQSAVKEFSAMAVKMKGYFPDWPVEYGYLEFADPVIRVGLDNLIAQGVTHILAVPCMLFAAGHAKNDIPSVLNAYAAEKGVTIQYGRELAVSLSMISAAGDRVQQAIKVADEKYGPVPVFETCLVVIGRGASDPDANSNISKIARMLWEGLGFGWCEVGYSGVTFPLVEPCLSHVVKLGYRRVIIFPYFLFSGILIDRIYGFTDKVAAANPNIQFQKAGYLNDHPKVLSTLAERVTEIIEGSNLMNCALCKYRSSALGFEDEVGLPQESHHHHVEGAGALAPGSNIKDCFLCDEFCTGACRLTGNSHRHAHEHGHYHTHNQSHDHDHEERHDQGHHHHPYPHAKHPHGPESVRKSMPASGTRGEKAKD